MPQGLLCWNALLFPPLSSLWQCCWDSAGSFLPRWWWFFAAPVLPRHTPSAPVIVGSRPSQRRSWSFPHCFPFFPCSAGLCCFWPSTCSDTIFRISRDIRKLDDMARPHRRGIADAEAAVCDSAFSQAQRGGKLWKRWRFADSVRFRRHLDRKLHPRLQEGGRSNKFNALKALVMYCCMARQARSRTMAGAFLFHEHGGKMNPSKCNQASGLLILNSN